MTYRHLLTHAHELLDRPLHLAHTTAKHTTTKHSGGLILGLPLQTFIMLAAAAAVGITVICILFVAYRRRRTLVDYNQNPEQFPNLPPLSYKESKNLKKRMVKTLIKGDEDVQVDKSNDINGPFYKLVFKGNKPQAVIFDYMQQRECCYFEIEVFNLHGEVEIGFVQGEAKDKVENLEEDIGVSGVSLSTSGLVVTKGENIYNYNWSLDYGDVIGLAITKENDKFNERRAWISKNGVLLNLPPHNEMDKWLATVNITADEREKFDIGKEKNTVDDPNKDPEAADKAAEAEKLAFEREQTLLQGQCVSMKTFKAFKFYPIVYYHGLKGDGKGANSVKDRTLINLNVGGQVFRMQEAQFKGGVLQ